MATAISTVILELPKEHYPFLVQLLYLLISQHTIMQDNALSEIFNNTIFCPFHTFQPCSLNCFTHVSTPRVLPTQRKGNHLKFIQLVACFSPENTLLLSVPADKMPERPQGTRRSCCTQAHGQGPRAAAVEPGSPGAHRTSAVVEEGKVGRRSQAVGMTASNYAASAAVPRQIWHLC